MKDVVDRGTGDLKGHYAFVWTGSVEQATAAKNALHNVKINGKKLQVKVILSCVRLDVSVYLPKFMLLWLPGCLCLRKVCPGRRLQDHEYDYHDRRAGERQP